MYSETFSILIGICSIARENAALISLGVISLVGRSYGKTWEEYIKQLWMEGYSDVMVAKFLLKWVR
jgi:hypothetical protein